MEGGIAGTGRTNLQDSLPHPDLGPNSRNAAAAHLVATADLVEDEVENSLLNLASPEIGRLLEDIEQRRLTLDPARAGELLQSAAEAAASKDLPRAIAAITELTTKDPEYGTQLVRESASLAPIRGDVNELLQKLALAAKSNAEHILAAASIAVENGPRAGVPSQMLVLAQRFYETGQHINFVRAAEIGQAILVFFPAETGEIKPRAAKKQASERRAPVLGFWGWISLGILLLAAFVLLVFIRS